VVRPAPTCARGRARPPTRRRARRRQPGAQMQAPTRSSGRLARVALAWTRPLRRLPARRHRASRRRRRGQRPARAFVRAGPGPLRVSRCSTRRSGRAEWVECGPPARARGLRRSGCRRDRPRGVPQTAAWPRCSSRQPACSPRTRLPSAPCGRTRRFRVLTVSPWPALNTRRRRGRRRRPRRAARRPRLVPTPWPTSPGARRLQRRARDPERPPRGRHWGLSHGGARRWRRTRASPRPPARPACALARVWRRARSAARQRRYRSRGTPVGADVIDRAARSAPVCTTPLGPARRRVGRQGRRRERPRPGLP